MNRVIKLAFFAILLLLAACANKRGQLKPLTPGDQENLLISSQPQLVTFSELQAEPEAFQDRLIRVTGNFFALQPPACYPYSGPGAEWALISEGLRLDIVGFERVSQLLELDTLMTVDGFFRLYEGRLGCGKGAPLDSAWYLELYQIVQPNPLAKVAGIFDAGDGTGLIPPQVTATQPGSPSVTQPPIGGTSQPTTIPTQTPFGTAPILPPATGTATPAGTLPSTIIPTATSTPQPTSDLTATIPPVSTNTRVPGVTPGSTATTGPFPTSPPLATATEGYPGVPTATVGGYPGLGSTAEPTSYP